MKNKYLFLIIAITVLFQSCEKEIEFSSETITPKLVVNGFIHQDSLISIVVGTTKLIPGVEKAFTWIDNATVKLFVDGIEKETLTTYDISYDTTNFNYFPDTTRAKKGYHTLTTQAETGKTYRLEISHPNYKTINCETTLPKTVVIESIDTITQLIDPKNSYSGTHLKVTLKFSDPSNEKNYYRLVYKSLLGVVNTTDTVSHHSIIVYNQNFGTDIDSEDPVLNPEQENANDLLLGTPNNTYNLFTGDYIDGKEYEMSFFISPYYMKSFRDIDTSNGEFLRLTIELQSISEDAYLYMKSVSASNYYNNDLFSEPVQVYTNIENGTGIFAGYSSDSKTIQKGEYPIAGINYQIQNQGFYYFYYSY